MRRLYCLGCQRPFNEAHPHVIDWVRSGWMTAKDGSYTGTDDLPWINLHSLVWAYTRGPREWGVPNG